MGANLEKVFAALDNMSKEEMVTFLSHPDNTVSKVKIGLEAFCRYGTSLVHELHDDHGKEIFLDLKLHDIPNTVAKAVHALEGLPIKFLTIHMTGGAKMIEAALEAGASALANTTIVGVSYLTSFKEEDFVRMWGPGDTKERFDKIFNMGIESGMKAMVMSASDIASLRPLEKKHGVTITKICPGIRFADEIAKGSIDDQVRVVSPEDAIKNGADYLVMGRSLTAKYLN